jgi:uncharacterized DUF497 family protein
MQYQGVEWSKEKNRMNQRNHGISFEVAQYIFADAERIERLDESEGNTSGEVRYQTLGNVNGVLFVVYTERGEKARLISARRAKKAERRSYHGYYLIDNCGWTKASERDTAESPA